MPLLLGCFVMDRLITDMLRRSVRGDAGVWNDLFEGRIKADLAIYGSSRAWVNFDTRILEDSLRVDAYNLGADGFDFMLQYCRHQLLVSGNKRPEVIIMALDYFMFTKRESLPNPDQFLAYIMEPELKTALAEYDEFDFFDYNIPFCRYIGRRSAFASAVRQIIFPESNRPDRYRGYAGKDLTWNTDLSKAMATKRRYVQRIDLELVALFEQFVAECKASGVTLIMIYPPEFVAGQTFVSNRNEIFDLFDSIARSNGIPFLDYSSDILSRDRSLFYNSQHLNRTGAEKFTADVAKKLRSLLDESGSSVIGNRNNYDQ